MAIRERVAATAVPNGMALASFLAAGIGAFALGAIVVLNELDLFAAPSLYDPAGGVTGRTALGALIWLIAWALLHWRWRNRTMRAGGVYALTLALVALGIVLTFPPVWHLFG
jgi:multisubunit Na+/H+ antiporter MnhG subunit